jgi:hypothetical protein
MLHALEPLVLSRFVAFQLVCDEHSRHNALLLEALAKQAFGDLCLPLPLPQKIEHVAFRSHRSPSVIMFAFKGDNDFIELPFICELTAFAPHLIGILLSKLVAPCSHRLVGYFNPRSSIIFSMS